MARIQTLAKPLWTETPVNDPNYYVFYFIGKKKMRAKVADKEEARAKVESASKKGYGAFASGPIPCNAGQHGVFMFASAGCTKECALRKNDNEKVNVAYRSVFCDEQTKPSEKTLAVEKIAKDVSESLVVFVWFEHQSSHEPYAYRCKCPHKKGDKVTVGVDPHKEVTVDRVASWTEDQIKVYAKSKGYNDLTPLWREGPMTDEDWADNYTEDVDELNAMRECYQFAADETVHDVDEYVERERDHETCGFYDGSEDYDDLPE